MNTQQFDQFVARQQEDPTEPAVNWKQMRDEWLQDLDALYKRIETYLATYTASGKIRCEYEEIRLIEDHLGTYPARQMVIKIGRQEVRLTPVGTLIIASKGRVDVEGIAGRAQMLLIDKRATSPASLIKVTVNVGAKAARVAAQKTQKPEWEWKIVERPPARNFIPLTRDAFLTLLMQLADGH